MPKNTGTPGIPRNVGIQFARGKYIAFLDSDDLYTKTALEELSTLAEEFQADVVRINSWFRLWGNSKKYVDDPAFTKFDELTNPANFTVKTELDPQLLTAPVLIPDNIAERVKHFMNWGTFWTSWLSFCRRDFLISNQIQFPAMIQSEDAPFVFECFILAKKFLRVPNAIYINRPRAGSVSKEDDSKFNVPEYMHKAISALRDGFNKLNKSMNKVAFFKEHPEYRHAVLDFFFSKDFSWRWELQNIYAQVHPSAINPLVEKEFSSDDAALAAYMFNTINVYRLQLARLQQENFALKKELQQYRSAKVQ